MDKVNQLPLRLLGLDGIPAVPVQIRGLIGSLLRLSVRAEETKQAMHGLSHVYTLGGVTGPAYTFLFGETDDESDPAPEAPGQREGILSFFRARLHALLQFLHIGGAGHCILTAARRIPNVLFTARPRPVKP